MNLGEKLRLLTASYLKPSTDGASPISKENMVVKDVTDLILDMDLSKFEVLQWAPIWMTRAERLLMFSMTFCLCPQRYLEIGTFQGGSALVVGSAMDALNSNGKIICVDPKPQIEPEHWARIEHRATLLRGSSPEILPEALEAAGDKFDMVLIDGDHTISGVIHDIEGVLPYVEDGGYLLFHDSFYPGVKKGIEYCLQMHQDMLVDFGTMTREVTTRAHDPKHTHWGGIRMAQIRRGMASSMDSIETNP